MSKDLHTRFQITHLAKPTDHQVPNDDVWVTHFVEDLAGIAHPLATRVDLQRGDADGGVAREPESNNVRVDASAENVVAEVGGGLEERRESVLVGGDGAGFHEGEKGEGSVEGWV